MRHDCGSERSIAYFAEPLALMALFSKKVGTPAPACFLANWAACLAQLAYQCYVQCAHSRQWRGTEVAHLPLPVRRGPGRAHAWSRGARHGSVHVAGLAPLEGLSCTLSALLLWVRL